MNISRSNSNSTCLLCTLNNCSCFRELQRTGKLSQSGAQLVTRRSRSLGQILKSQELRRGLFKCVQIWYIISSRYRQYTAGVQGQRSKVKVTGSYVKVTANSNVSAAKRYNTTMDRFSSATSNVAWCRN